MCPRKMPGGVISIAYKNPSVYIERKAMRGGTTVHTPDADAMDNPKTGLVSYSRHPLWWRVPRCAFSEAHLA